MLMLLLASWILVSLVVVLCCLVSCRAVDLMFTVITEVLIMSFNPNPFYVVVAVYAYFFSLQPHKIAVF